jgi:hypothetical protein
LDDLWVVVEWEGVAECDVPVKCVAPNNEWLPIVWGELLDGVCLVVGLWNVPRVELLVECDDDFEEPWLDE